jgi:hypothetical protein
VPATVHRLSRALVIPLSFTGLLAASSAAGAAASAAIGWLTGQGYAPPTPGAIVACHGYGCVRRTAVPVEAPWLGRAEALLKANHGSAFAERRALAEVVRIYTAEVASEIGGKRDLPRSPPGMSNVVGQMDCLDVTANITSLFIVLESRGLLDRHHVESPQSRGVFFDGRWPHYTAVLSADDGSRWAVDPWAKAPGERPDVMPLDRWAAAGR